MLSRIKVRLLDCEQFFILLLSGINQVVLQKFSHQIPHYRTMVTLDVQIWEGDFLNHFIMPSRRKVFVIMLHFNGKPDDYCLQIVSLFAYCMLVKYLVAVHNTLIFEI